MNYAIHSAWDKSYHCQGPPDTIYRFSINETTVPLSFDIVTQTYPATLLYEFCGFSPYPQPNHCCWSSASLSDTQFASFMLSSPSQNSSEALTFWTPASAVGASYCHIVYPGELNMVERWTLGNGACHDSFACSGGTLSVWNDTNCEIGIPESYVAPISQVSFFLNGEITVDYLTIHQGDQRVEWEGIMPGYLAVVQFDTPPRLVGGACVIAGMCFSLFGILWWARKLYKLVTYQSISCFLSQVLLLVAITTLALVNSIVISDDATFYTLNEVTGITQNLSTLILLFVSVYNLIRTLPGYFLWNKRWKKATVFGTLLILHFVLAWPFYDKYQYLIDWAYIWQNNTVPLWYFICLLTNNACLVSLVFFIASQTVKNREGVSVLTFLLTEALYSFILMVFCILNVVFYLVLCLFTYYSNWAGGDRNILSCINVAFVAFPFNSMLSIAIIDVENSRRRNDEKSKSNPGSIGTNNVLETNSMALTSVLS